MNNQVLLKGEELYQLIPQRNPIVMIDALFNVDGQCAETGLSITDDNVFCENGIFSESGLIEHIAQSAAAFVGYDSYTKGKLPRLGFIGEVKKFKITRLPQMGERLHSILKVLGEVDGVTLIVAETFSKNEMLVRGQMKIFLKEG